MECPSNQTKMFERLACPDLSKEQLITMIGFLRICGWKYNVEHYSTFVSKIILEKQSYIIKFERYNSPKKQYGLWEFYGNDLWDYISPSSEFGSILVKSNIKIKKLRCINLKTLSGIGNLDSLIDLEIQNCRSAIPPEIGNLQKLKKLHVHGGKDINSLPTTIGHLKKLESLVIQETNISSLPCFISNLKNLMELILQDNQIDHLPQEIHSLANLEKIIIDYEENLTVLPQGIWELPNLKSLRIGIKELSEIPAEICKLRNLRELIVLRSNLSTIPLSLQDLPVLERLDLSGNRLTEFPKGIAGLKNLQELCLSGNNISEIPDEIVDGLLSMDDLLFFDIRDNPDLKWNEKLDKLCEKILTCIH